MIVHTNAAAAALVVAADPSAKAGQYGSAADFTAQTKGRYTLTGQAV